MTTETLLQAMLARPANFRVFTVYANGNVKTHDVHSLGQAENWATGERRKIGRDLIDRNSGNLVRVVKVEIASITQ